MAVFLCSRRMARQLNCSGVMRFVSIFLLMLAALPANAFVPYRTQDGAVLRWPTGLQDLDLTLLHEDSPVTPGAFRQAVEEAFATWSRVSRVVPEARVSQPVEQEPVSTEPGDGQRVHKIQFVAADWPYDPNAVAVTVFSFKKSTGHMIDADIYINAAGSCFDLSQEARCFDLQSVLTHEAGHFLGLNHNSSDEEVVMYPTAESGSLRLRTLTDDDREGIASIYGGTAQQERSEAPLRQPQIAQGRGAEMAVSRAGCRAAGEGSISLAVLAVLGLLARRRTLGLIAVIVSGWCGAAQASSIAPETFAEQLHRADAVFVGRAVQRRSYFDIRLGLIVTEHTLTVDQCVRGTCGERVVFRTLGGEVGDVVTRVSGEAEPDPHESTLFVASKRTLFGGTTVFESTAFGRGVLRYDARLHAFRSALVPSLTVRADDVLR